MLCIATMRLCGTFNRSGSVCENGRMIFGTGSVRGLLFLADNCGRPLPLTHSLWDMQPSSSPHWIASPNPSSPTSKQHLFRGISSTTRLQFASSSISKASLILIWMRLHLLFHSFNKPNRLFNAMIFLNSVLECYVIQL